MADIPPAQFKPGWWRFTSAGWEWVCGPDQDPGDDDRLDLVLVEHGAEEVPLW